MKEKRDQFGTNFEHLLNKRFLNDKLDFKENYSLEYDVYFMKHYHLVTDDKFQPNVLINQWQLYFCPLKLFYKYQYHIAFNLMAYSELLLLKF